MDPIGIALGAIALLDPAYTRIRQIWDGFQDVRSFDHDLSQLTTRLALQGVNFLSSLEKIKAHLLHDQVEGRQAEPQRKALIKDQIEEITWTFGKCYQLVKSCNVHSECFFQTQWIKSSKRLHH